jgi:hypothetical protein
MDGIETFLISIGGQITLALLIIWSLAWKGVGLWRAGRNNQLIWFIALLIFNTVGILPILYIFLFQPQRKR